MRQQQRGDPNDTPTMPCEILKRRKADCNSQWSHQPKSRHKTAPEISEKALVFVSLPGFLSLRAVHEIVSWLTCPLGRGVMRAEEVMLQRDASWLATCRQGIRHSGFSVHVVDYLTRRWQNVLLFGTLQILCAHLRCNTTPHTFN